VPRNVAPCANSATSSRCHSVHLAWPERHWRPQQQSSLRLLWSARSADSHLGAAAGCDENAPRNLLPRIEALVRQELAASHRLRRPASFPTANEATMFDSRFRFALFAACVGHAGTAQTITEIASMSVPHSVVDMDTVGGAGPITLAQINAAGTNGGAGIAGITLLPSAAPQGVYNTNPGRGRALARDLTGSGLILVDPPSGAFGAFDARIDLSVPSMEIGMSIGDWNGPMVQTYYRNGVVVATHTTSSYSATSQLKYFAMVGGTFDRIDLRASTTAGNWVVPDLVVQRAGTRAPALGVWMSASGSGAARTTTIGLPVTGGPSGGAYALFASPRFTTPLPLPPYGFLHLQLAGLTQLGAFPLDAGGSGNLTLPFLSASLDGLVLALQAFVVGPGTAALTDWVGIGSSQGAVDAGETAGAGYDKENDSVTVYVFSDDNIEVVQVDHENGSRGVIANLQPQIGATIVNGVWSRKYAVDLGVGEVIVVTLNGQRHVFCW